MAFRCIFHGVKYNWKVVTPNKIGLLLQIESGPNTVDDEIYSIPKQNYRPSSMSEIPLYSLIRSLVLIMLLWGIVLSTGGSVLSQDNAVDDRIDRIDTHSMTQAELRWHARELGIDLTDPERAAVQARQMGVPDSTIRKLKAAARARQSARSSSDESRGVVDGKRDTTGTGVPSVADTLDSTMARPDTVRRDTAEGLPYFGYGFFKGVPEAFKPGRVGPVDDNYLINPGDELRLIVWGSAEFQYDLPVDKEGRVFVPNVGQLLVAGKRLDELRNEMKQWLSQSYAGLTAEPPTAFMDLTVTRLQPIHVYILGEVAYPGGYTVSNNSTVFNALYSVGGPLRRGSLRDIRVIRNGEVVATVDMYEHLLRGFESDEIRLQNNDRIFVPMRSKTVSIRGEVRRPAHYELHSGETFADLLSYAGGLTAEAYGKRFQIERILPLEDRTDPSVAREVMDFPLKSVLSDKSHIPLEDGDRVRIFSIVDRYRNAVTVSGGVYQPGRYELSEGVRTVRDLVRKADGLTPDAYLERADLIRETRQGGEQQISLDLQKIMAGVAAADPSLRTEDSLHIYSIQELQHRNNVTISGQVRMPGRYMLRDSMTVSDLLFRGGGLVDSVYLQSVYLQRADLFRKTPDGQHEIIIPFHLEKALQGEGLANTLLQAKDEIRIYPRTVDDFASRRHVYITGTVKEPGRYRYQKNMTLADLLLQAGGFAEGADLHEVEVARAESAVQDNGEARIIRVPLVPENLEAPGISFALDDSSLAMQNAHTFPLKYRDRVYVRKNPSYEPQDSVVVTGEVRYPGEYTLVRDNERLSDIIRRAGGLKSTAYPKGGRLMRSNEQLITRIDAAVEEDPNADVILQPGDEIIIPPQPNTVSVQGNVANAGLIKHEQGRRLHYYIKRAGGTGERVEHIYLTQASGATYRVDTRWYWFDPNPVVDDGAVIRVTQRPPKEEIQFDLGKTITDVTQIVSTTLTILVLATRLQGG